MFPIMFKCQKHLLRYNTQTDFSHLAENITFQNIDESYGLFCWFTLYSVTFTTFVSCPIDSFGCLSLITSLNLLRNDETAISVRLVSLERHERGLAACPGVGLLSCVG